MPKVNLPTIKLLAAALIAALASGCIGPSMTDAPIPTIDNRPNPTPVRGYRVRCQSVPALTNFVSGDFNTGCQQIIPPYGVAIRAKG